MANISPEQIRDISVKAVEDFLNNSVPLSEGLAKQAAAYELNSEQVKRAVESTNNIAYLKVLQLSKEDRTIEFPLAKYAEVMTAATVPSNFQEKSAAAISVQQKEELTKQASAYEERELEQGEKLTYFIKTAAANKEALERIQIESMNVAERLVKVAKAISADDKWMDKLACVTSEQEFKELSILVSGSVQKYRNISELGLFKEAQLNDVKGFSDLYKQARELVREQRERSALQKQAAAAAQGINQNNFADAMKNVSKKSAQFAKNIANPGYLAGKAVGTAAAMPLKGVAAAGRAASDSVKANVKGLMEKGVGKPSAVVKAVGKTSGSFAGRAFGLATGPVADVALYDPGTDSTTGRSNDAWTALQRD